MYLSGRDLGACDPCGVMLHATLLMGMSLMLRFNELAALYTDHLGRGEVNLTFSIPTGTKNFFQKKYYSLTPWPTTVKLDPRYVCALILTLVPL